MKSVGRRATARVVSQGVIAASARVAERLQLAKGTKVMQIKRVRLADAGADTARREGNSLPSSVA
jgi:GntR family transcriptional regulator